MSNEDMIEANFYPYRGEIAYFESLPYGRPSDYLRAFKRARFEGLFLRWGDLALNSYPPGGSYTYLKGVFLVDPITTELYHAYANEDGRIAFESHRHQANPAFQSNN